MSARQPCPAAPGPLEGYAARFDDLFTRVAQRRGFREYLAGLLAPRDRNKTLTALAGAEPVTGAQHAAVQRLQFFLSESRWDAERVNARRLELLRADPATAPHGGGVLVIDDSGDRKDGVKTAHVGHQWLGRYGKTDNGVVTVTTVWADERLYYPVDAVPYTPAKHFAKGKGDPGFRTKLAIGADLAVRARDAGFAFRAVAADSAYGDQDGFRGELAEAGLPFVMALKPRRGTWAYGADAHTPVDAARDLAWGGPDDPGDWRPVTRAFRDGHTETWWAADATLGWWGPDGARRLVVATADPGTLPGKATWYLVTNLPRPGGPRVADSPHPPADLAEIVRIYGIRHWIEQSYKQVKDELGWADFQVRSDTAIRRHQVLVNCAFSFCWAAWFADHPPQHDAAPPPGPGGGERGPRARRTAAGAVLAAGAARSARLAFPLDRAAALVAGMVEGAPAAAAASPDQLGRGRPRPAPLHPYLTNYRYGPEHPATLAARHRLAHWTGDAGDAAGARDQYTALLHVFERVVGPEHPDTLTARGNLAHWTGEAGDAAGARDQFAALLPIRERESGAEHLDTLTARGNLARWTGEAGNAAAARDQFAALLPIEEQILGPEHPGTLTTRDNFANYTGVAGDAVGARDQYAALLPIRERVLGAEHPDTLNARGNLAYWTGMAGDAAGARDQFAALLPIRERVLGAEHPDTLAARSGLADWTGEGDAARGRDQFAALLPIRERVSGPDHPETLAVRDNLANYTGVAGDPAGARDQFAALLPIRERVLGADHRDTLATRDNIRQLQKLNPGCVITVTPAEAA